MRTFEVPVIVTVTVEVGDDGAMVITGARPDSDGGPWIESTVPAVWEPVTADGLGFWHRGHGADDHAVAAWHEAYEVKVGS